MLEESAKKLSFKLSEKLERKEITIEEMARIVDEFLELSGQTGDIEEINNFLKKYD